VVLEETAKSKSVRIFISKVSFNPRAAMGRVSRGSPMSHDNDGACLRNNKVCTVRITLDDMYACVLVCYLFLQCRIAIGPKKALTDERASRDSIMSHDAPAQYHGVPGYSRLCAIFLMHYCKHCFVRLT